MKLSSYFKTFCGFSQLHLCAHDWFLRSEVTFWEIFVVLGWSLSFWLWGCQGWVTSSSLFFGTWWCLQFLYACNLGLAIMGVDTVLANNWFGQLIWYDNFCQRNIIDVNDIRIELFVIINVVIWKILAL